MSIEQRSRHSLFAKHQPSGHGARRGESSLYRSNSNGTRFGNGRGNGTRHGNQFDGEDLSRSMPNAPFIGSHGSSEMAMSRYVIIFERGNIIAKKNIICMVSII